MKRIILLSTFLLAVITLSGQNGQQGRVQTKRYSGTMSNGLMKPGEVSYYYYKKNRKKIMHGVFRYRLRWRSEIRQRVYQTISGSMKHGLKSGNWNYSLTVKDYFKDKDGYFYTMDIQMNASYEGGVPDGVWQFNKTKKKRKKIEDSRKIWGEYTGKNMYSIYLHFDEGKLVDSVYFKDKANNILIKGSLDSNSLFHGDWVIQKGKTRKEETYFHGLVTHRVQKNARNGNIENKESLMENKNMWVEYTSENTDISQLTFNPDTISILRNADHVIAQMINEHIFDYRAFLYSYIPGDSLIREYAGDNPASLFKGLKKVEFESQVNKIQAKKLSSISQKTEKIRRIHQQAKEVAQKNNTTKQAKDNIRRLNYISNLSGKYDCMTGVIKLYMNMDKGRNKAYEKCNLQYTVNIKLPTDLSKNELLDHIRKNVNNYYKEAKKLLKKVEEY